MSKKGKKQKKKTKQEKLSSNQKEDVASADKLSESDESSGKTADDAKVIDRKGAKLIVSGSAPKQEDSAEPREISIEPRRAKPRKEEQLQMAFDDVSHEESTPAKTVVRLENRYDPAKERPKVEKAKFEKLEAGPDEAEKTEQKWGGEISVGWWLAIAGVGVAALILAAVIFKYTFFSNADATEVEAFTPPPVLEPDPYAGTPKQWFHENMPFVEKRIFEILVDYNKSEDLTARSKLVRDPESYLRRAKSWHRNFRPRSENDEEVIVKIDSRDELAYIVLSTKDQDFMPLIAYFVRQGNDIKLDWHASVAWSEISMKTIKHKSDAQRKEAEQSELDYAVAVQKAKQAAKDYEQRIFERENQVVPASDVEQAQEKIYTVRRGDTLGAIAQKHDVQVSDLAKENDIANSLIKVGQKLKIPGNKNEVVEIPKKAEPANLPEPPPSWETIPKPQEPDFLFSEPLQLRCLLTRRDEFYAGPYNEQNHSAFMIRSADKRTYFWAYVPRGSELDDQLRRLLDHGRFVVDLKKDYPVTIRVKRKQKDALPSQLELVELLHSEWVSP